MTGSMSDGQLLQYSWRGTLSGMYRLNSGFHSQNKRVLVFEPIEELDRRMAVQKRGTRLAPSLCRIIRSRGDSALGFRSFLATP